jgi:putative ABC transport system permease protein
MKTALLVVALATFLGLPLVMRSMSRVIQESLMARAESTPLLLGTKGSSLDLVVESLYFQPKAIEPLSFADATEIDDTGLAAAIPLRTGLFVQKVPLVGTTLEYVGFRDLHVERGRMFAQLGECVVGSRAAKTLGVHPGDSVITSPSTMFDLAGVYPLRLDVVGTLAPSQSPDDGAVFVDLKTEWVAEGLGHGHQELSAAPSDVLLPTKDGTATANAKLVQYNEITKDNVGSFHFHGDDSTYPVSSILVVPNDEKSGVLLRGRFIDDASRQLLRPANVVEGLNQQIFRFERVLELIVSTVGLATALMFVLVMVLSWRLRADELRTMTRIGCSRFKAAQIMGAEVVLMVGSGVVLAGVLGLMLTTFGETWLQTWILGGS